MSILHYKNNQLHIENSCLATIAKTYSTPTYVYSRQALEQNYLQYRGALDNDSTNKHLVCFAVKANSNLGVLSVLAKLGSGFDIVSVGELERVLLAGGNAKKVIFSGVAKMDSEIARALEVGIRCFNVESESELHRIAKIATKMNCVAAISMRVNPDVDAQTHPYISTGLQENKFGIDINDAPRVYALAKQQASLNIVGIDCHIGSQLTTLAPFKDALDRVLHLVDQLDSEGIDLKHIDVGGGLGVRYDEEQPPAIAEYIDALFSIMKDRPQELILEPGRSIAANAGVLLMRVDTIKRNPSKNFAIVDAAMNDMLRPALYDAWMNVLPVTQSNSSTVNSSIYDIVGPICETSDFLAKQRELKISEGDLLCMDSAGAYGFVMASNYNSRGRAAEIIIDGDQQHCVRERETLADLVKGEKAL